MRLIVSASGPVVSVTSVISVIDDDRRHGESTIREADRQHFVVQGNHPAMEPDAFFIRLSAARAFATVTGSGTRRSKNRARPEFQPSYGRGKNWCVQKR
ncbi:hypothetical protein [Caballeronia sp. ATUFL_M2_KS44]|uniref:hypothetical protein n=1 Tax=Caballeronia sp. ATUFL_M2_KS44 TaxID=2921767 RepID=UPI0020297DD9|nr:hypothetical protein [Caballeronia sp. ATUFL_M2_KS44]